MAGIPAYSIYNQVPHNIGCINNLSLTTFNPPNSIGLVPRKPTYHHTQIKSQTTTHETWLNTFITDNTKKRVQKCKEYHEKKIDKVELTLDDLQAYAIYSTAVNTFKETKDKTTKQYNKDLEAIELEIDELAKEINKQILTREQQQQKTDRTKEIQQLKAESEGILQDIRRIEKL